MAQTGLTKKQLWYQLVPAFVDLVVGAMWLIIGITDKNKTLVLLGALFTTLSCALVISLIVQRRRNPVENPELDASLTKKFNEGIKGLGTLAAFIVIGLLIAFGLVALLR